MKIASCPCCGQPVEPEYGDVKMGADGLPLAASLVPGLGLPLAGRGSLRNITVKFNGEDMPCVAFDRERDLLWRHQPNGAGKIMFRDGKPVIERIGGKVTLERTA